MSPCVSDLYSMVVMQSGTLCNLDCSYCYLPGRKADRRMPVEVAQAVAADITEHGRFTTVLWHAGEPLAIGPAALRQLLDPFKTLVAADRVRHLLQTNATLITPQWCDVFREHQIQPSVSLDGPPRFSAERRGYRGRPAFDRIMRGVATLREHDFDPDVICVVTPDALGSAAEILDWFEEHGFHTVAFNIEEREGVNTQRDVPRFGAVVQFWHDVIEYMATSPIQVREVSYLAGGIGRPLRADLARDPLPTVTHDGQVVLLSPELAGLAAPDYDDFIVGNVLRASLSTLVRQRPRYVTEFEQALRTCQSMCPFWSMCGGAYASNRHAEHGTFTTTETAYCQNSRQAVALAAARHAEQEGDVELIHTLSHLIQGATP